MFDTQTSPAQTGSLACVPPRHQGPKCMFAGRNFNILSGHAANGASFFITLSALFTQREPISVQTAQRVSRSHANSWLRSTTDQTMSFIHLPHSIHNKHGRSPLRLFTEPLDASSPAATGEEASSSNNTSSAFLITHGPRPTCVYCFLPCRCSCHA